MRAGLGVHPLRAAAREFCPFPFLPKRGQEVALVSTPREPKRENAVLFLALVSASLVSRSLPPSTAKVGENSVARRPWCPPLASCSGRILSISFLGQVLTRHFNKIQSCSASVLNTLPTVYFAASPDTRTPFLCGSRHFFNTEMYQPSLPLVLVGKIPRNTNRIPTENTESVYNSSIFYAN